MAERIVVIGKGAREHALAKKLTGRSREVIVLLGNPGIAREFLCIEPATMEISVLVETAVSLRPDLVIIGPENFLALGLADALRARGIATFGPSKMASQLEESKQFTKQVCDRAKIPTARYGAFSNLKDAYAFVEDHELDDLVVKVDALCAGKGVTVCHSKQHAKKTLSDLFERDGFKALSAVRKEVVIEEFLQGEEISVFGAAHDTDVVLFCPLKDFKTLRDHGDGPNTGGMGAGGPLGDSSAERERFLGEIKERFFLPTLHAMKNAGRPFSGLLYAGLMVTDRGVFLLEYNVRFGDPETQALLFGTDADIYPLLQAIAHNEPFDHDTIQQQLLTMQPTISIVMAGAGYPTSSATPCPLTIPTHISQDTQILFADTQVHDGTLLSGSGRVLNVVARASTVDAARTLGYELVRKIDFAGKQFRTDIGTNLSRLRGF